jgi:NAD(P)-dependent dehydrogenase (short-subunit alcohol dehydrogenase family)
MMYPNFYEEYLVWLGLISVTWVIFHYWAFYLLFLWTVYFFATRMLERIQIGDLYKRAVLISGCDSGFGRDLALKCIENGMPVFAGCLTEQGINEINEEAKRIKDGEKLLKAIQLNICKQESVTKMREVIDESGLGLFAVVNNAVSLKGKGNASFQGIGDNRAFDDWQSPEMYQRFFDINTLGHIRVTHVSSI